MGELGGSSDVFLVVGSAREISCPESVFIISIGEHVIILGGPFDIQLIDCINIHPWSGVQESDLGILLIEVRNKSVNRVKEHSSIHVVEILAHGNKEVVSRVMITLVDDPIVK